MESNHHHDNKVNRSHLLLLLLKIYNFIWIVLEIYLVTISLYKTK